MISEYLLDQGCSCHNMAPCSFCMELSEGEANAYSNGGMDGLRKYLRERRDQEEETAELNEFLDKHYE